MYAGARASATATGGVHAAIASLGQSVVPALPGDPYANCDGPGITCPSAEEEPYVSVDQRNAIGIFRQGRWSNGGARALTATRFTETAFPLTHRTPCGLPFQRASDGWVGFGPDGTGYFSGLVLDAADACNGGAASASYDGGRIRKRASRSPRSTRTRPTAPPRPCGRAAICPVWPSPHAAARTTPPNGASPGSSTGRRHPVRAGATSWAATGGLTTNGPAVRPLAAATASTSASPRAAAPAAPHRYTPGIHRTRRGCYASLPPLVGWTPVAAWH